MPAVGLGSWKMHVTKSCLLVVTVVLVGALCDAIGGAILAHRLQQQRTGFTCCTADSGPCDFVKQGISVFTGSNADPLDVKTGNFAGTNDTGICVGDAGNSDTDGQCGGGQLPFTVNATATPASCRQTLCNNVTLDSVYAAQLQQAVSMTYLKLFCVAWNACMFIYFVTTGGTEWHNARKMCCCVSGKSALCR